MTLSEVTFVPLFLWKAVALWNVLPMPFFPFLSCVIFNSTEFSSQCSCFIYRRAWISTRWSGCCVKWRSFWKARRCGLQRASGSWSQSWRHFRTLSPRCLRRTSQLASGPLTYVKFYHDNFKGALCKTLSRLQEKKVFTFFRIRYFMTSEGMFAEIAGCTLMLMSVKLFFIPSAGTAALVPFRHLTLFTKEWRIDSNHCLLILRIKIT